MKQKNSTIYLITNNVNGKIYVGRTCARKSDRWAQHLRAARKGFTYRLSRAIRKHGPDAFKISTLEKVAHSEAAHREEHWITRLNALDPAIGYNLAVGPRGASTDKIRTDTRQKLGEASKRYWGGMTSEQRSGVLRQRMTGLPKSEAHALQLSESKAGKSVKTGTTTSDYTGVRLTQRGKWEANCYFKGIQYSKVFTTEVAAARAYDCYALALRGPAAIINFESDRTTYLAEDLSSFLESKHKVTSRYRHVSLHAKSGKWCVFISGKGRGEYETEDAAASAAAAAAACTVADLLRPTTRKKSRLRLTERASLPATT